MGVQITPEVGVTYEDIDTLIVEKRKGQNVTGKKYESYSEAFNSLSSAGLEFVQFVNLSTIGGATSFISDLKTNFILWRKRK